MTKGAKMCSIGARLKEERLRLKYSQTNIGAVGGVGKTTQINYEKSDRQPDAAYLAKVADVGVDVLYVLLGSRTCTDSSPKSIWEQLDDLSDSIKKIEQQKPVVDALDTSHLTLVIQTLEEMLAEENMTITAEEKAGLIVRCAERSRGASPADIMEDVAKSLAALGG